MSDHDSDAPQASRNNDTDRCTHTHTPERDHPPVEPRRNRLIIALAGIIIAAIERLWTTTFTSNSTATSSERRRTRNGTL